MSEKIQKRIAFGYNRGFSNKIEVNPIQAMVVKLLFELCNKIKSVQRIEKYNFNTHIQLRDELLPSAE